MKSSIPIFILFIYLCYSFFFKHLYWSIIALQWCVSLCFTTKWINYTYTYVPISPPSCVSLPPILPIPPLQVVTKHRADLPVPCGGFPLAIYSTFGSVYMYMPFSHFVRAYPSTSPYPQVHSLVGLCLYSHLAPGYSWPFFFLRFHVYVLAYNICFSLSDLHHSVWQTDGWSVHWWKWGFKVPYYDCVTVDFPFYGC